MVVTPSDALVINTGEFRRVVEKALRFTDNSSAIVTLGIKPTRPETGYGYIAAGDQIMTDKEIFTVDAFKEKPDRETADRYLAEGNYFWNAGIFVWNVRTITSVMRVYAPGIAQIFDRIFPDFYTEKENETIKKLFPYLRSYFHRLCRNGKSTGNLCTSGFFRLVGLGDLGSAPRTVATR